MFTFAHPWFVLLLPLVPVIIWRWLKRSRPALRYPDVSVFAAIPAGRGQWIQRVSTGTRLIALTLLVLALAGPRWPDQSTRIPTEGIAIAILVDVSGSMADESDYIWDGKPVSRIEAVRRAFRLLVIGGEAPDGEVLEGRPDDLISLTVFATRPDTICPLTLSHQVLVGELDKQEPRSITGECETNISDAIVEGLERLRLAGPRRKVMVLLSDGEHNVADPKSGWLPRQAAQVAGSLGIPIHTIDAGGDTPNTLEPGAPQTGNREYGIKTLKDVAQITSGKYFQARDTKSLLAVCQQIDKLERSAIQSYQYREYTEGFWWPALAAFVLLVGLQALEMTIWQRIP